MHRIIIAGCGTGVGKTIVSAILTTLWKADYWKPIQCGEEQDTSTMRRLLSCKKHHIYPSSYSLQAPLSPHHAARLENVSIDISTITPPQTTRPLVIEMVGGVFVPLTTKTLSLDVFCLWNADWIVVSQHYLGSINHTLLTIDALKRKNVKLLGIIFNGEINQDSESAILEISQIPFLGRLLPELDLNPQTIKRYAKKWRALLP